MASAVSGAAEAQAPAPDVPCLCRGADRPWRSQERSADGGSGREMAKGQLAPGALKAG